MELPPKPGVSSTGAFGSIPAVDDDRAPPMPAGASPMGGLPVKTGSTLPEHLRPVTTRMSALAAFPHVVISESQDPNKVGYAVTIPLDGRNSAKSMVRRGALPQEVYERYAHFYPGEEDEARPRRLVQVNNGRIQPVDDELEDDPRFAKQAASADSPIGPIPPYTPGAAGKMEKVINQPVDPNAPAQPKVQLTDWMKSKKKQEWDTRLDTKRPWERYKKVTLGSWRTPQVEQWAQRIRLDLTKVANFSFASPGMPPVLLDLVMLAHFGKQWLGWEPETIAQMIVQAGLVSEADLPSVFDKLMAIQLLRSNDAFWTDHGAFEKVSIALLGRPIDFQLEQVLTVEDMARAILLVRSLGGMRDKPFGDEVLSYIAAKVLANPGQEPTESRIHVDGLIYLPPPLDVAQAQLDQRQPELAPLVPQIRDAHARRWPVTGGLDVLNIQLDKCYRLEAYLRQV